MKSYVRICSAILLLMLLIFGAGGYFLSMNEKSEGRMYRVEAQRIQHIISDSGYESLDISGYSTVTGVFPVENEEDYYSCNSDYMFINAEDRIYRVEYIAENNSDSGYPLKVYLVTSAGFIILAVSAMIFTGMRIIKPFAGMSEIPIELSKGNLTVPIKEVKGKIFGKFAWGMDMLRENIEKSRERELELQKDRKTLLLSLSHDIKTPLSAIKLYTKALSKGLFPDKEKQEEVFTSINQKADEIEKYVNEIVNASQEDFLSITVENGEFYLGDAVERIRNYYKEKMELARVDFSIESYKNCLIKGDLERFVEVMQNIIENALKYGDGGYVRISFSEEEDCQLVSIANSGCTLESSELNGIFESFRRGSNSENVRGSGLGLYICRRIMRKMDGEIFAEIHGDEIVFTAVCVK